MLPVRLWCAAALAAAAVAAPGPLAGQTAAEPAGGIAVLAWHDLVDELPDDRPAGLSDTLERFESTLRFLREHGFRSVFPEEAGPPGQGGGRQVILTFDDGLRSAVAAAELLERYGFRGIFFVIPVRTDGGSERHLGPAELRRLAEGGHRVAPHGYAHRSVPASGEELAASLHAALPALKAAGVRPTRTDFAFPYGHYGRYGAEALGRVFRHLHTVNPGYWDGRAQRLPRMLIAGDLDPDFFREYLLGAADYAPSIRPLTPDGVVTDAVRFLLPPGSSAAGIELLAVSPDAAGRHYSSHPIAGAAFLAGDTLVLDLRTHVRRHYAPGRTAVAYALVRRRDGGFEYLSPGLHHWVEDPAGPPQPAARASWWRGNLHTHSLWSDGDDFPEMIAAWYRDHGYHFVVFTEHDRLQEGEYWVDVNAEDEGWPPRNASARAALPAYRERFGAEWVDERRDGDRHLVRLRPLAEYRDHFEAPGRFLLVMGEEITDRDGAHVNALNLDRAIPPQGGDDPADRIRNNLRAVESAREASGRQILAVVNHPNYLWALTAEELASIHEARFFELYNGHALVKNEGDSLRAGTERVWDVALSLRLAAGGPPLFGVATDDAHEYRDHSGTVARPGRAWTVVRAPRLTAEDLIVSLEAGDFYASTGVALRDVRCADGRFRVDVEPEPGVRYRTEFIGTRAGHPLEGRPVVTADGDTLRTTRVYDPGIGEVLAEMEGAAAEYVFHGDELYVRARITSSEAWTDPTTGEALGRQRAWTQPAVPGAAGSACDPPLEPVSPRLIRRTP